MNAGKFGSIFTLLSLFLVSPMVAAADPKADKVPVIIDTDIGSYIDDTFALALALSSPELDIRGITTTAGDAEIRAWMVCRLLTMVERKDIPVAFGAKPQPEKKIEGMYQYRNHPAAIYNRTCKPIKTPAAEFMYEQLKAQPGKLTLVAIGPLTNIARLLNDHSDCKPMIKRIVLMGGAVKVGYENKPPAEAEWNIKTDIKAAQAVFASGVPLVVAPLDATVPLKLEEPVLRKFFDAGTMLTYQIQAMHQMTDEETPTLYDPPAVVLCFNETFCTLQDLHVEVTDQGITKIGTGKPNARVATSIKKDAFLPFCLDRIAKAFPAAPAPPPGNLSKPVAQGSFPNRVHAFEDFDTDIERRWWMSGKLETANVPPGRGRACRGILTLDFDDLQGNLKTMYNAVIFNPVPGPPMGKNTRLSFRYWLKGTDTMRVQLYSLSNGYHRYLSINKLPQEKWESATVDMTAMRRPDGSGGPLGEGERIDDIQFYVDPKAELLIDDIVLYDAAVEGDKRPFPKNFHYTGLFDSGKQGKEWPGTFEIAQKKGYFWNAARSVDNPELGGPSIKLHLRGERPLGEATQLFFRYQLTGADSLRVGMVNRTAKVTHLVELKSLTKDKWAEATVDFTDAKPKKPSKGDRADELHFLLPKGAELLIDDVLLYEPGR
jgi:inosine-uridine nucleoside N-ribohydrolase